MSAVQEILVFLIDTLFNLYVSFLVIRMLLGFAKADFYNPISQFLVKITDPVIKPLRRFIPAIGKIDTATVVAIIGLKIIEYFLLSAVTGGNYPSDFIAFVIGDLLRMVVWIYIIAIIIQVIISWLGNTHGNPVVPLINSLTEPLIKPVRKIIPPIAMIDLSPMVVLILLQVALILIRSFGF
ncbi:MAG: YggT family protein [Thiotrichaceae bacterium]